MKKCASGRGIYSQAAQACKPVRRAPTWLTTALMEWNALLTILSIKDLAVAISTRAGPAEDDPPVYKLGLKPVQAVCKGESGTLN